MMAEEGEIAGFFKAKSKEVLSATIDGDRFCRLQTLDAHQILSPEGR